MESALAPQKAHFATEASAESEKKLNVFARPTCTRQI
jgi:hypothetical protein